MCAEQNGLGGQHRQRTGKWPRPASGPIPGARGETWMGIQGSLAAGSRGLPAGYTITRLLAEHRGIRNRARPPRLTEKGILAWAVAWHTRQGQWPAVKSGPIPDAPGETWTAIDLALARGRRGLPGGSSLTKLLAERRGLRNRNAPPPLSVERILAWARDHQERTGKWPVVYSGPVVATAGAENWRTVDAALREGRRGSACGVTVCVAHGPHRRRWPESGLVLERGVHSLELGHRR